jgi:DNA replication protein DnaC
MKTIQDFLLENRTTARARFEFSVPEAIETDLSACYRSVVEDSKSEFCPTQNALRILKSGANWMRSGKSGLLLTGGVGTGKTKLMMAFNLLFRYYTGDVQSLKIFSAQKICDMARSKIAAELDTVAKLKTYRYAGIDDLGAEPVTVKDFGTDLSPVIDILYARYDQGLTTLITTNDSPDAIRTKYGERIYDRIIEQYDIIVFNFKSFRQ